MKKSEISKLLTLAAALERSGWEPDDDDVTAWHAMALQGQWESFEAAERALLVYRSEQPDYPIRPGHITQVLERVRKQAKATFNPDMLPMPREAADDLGEYKAWIAREAAAHRGRLMDGFVRGDGPALRAIEAAS